MGKKVNIIYIVNYSTIDGKVFVLYSGQ